MHLPSAILTRARGVLGIQKNTLESLTGNGKNPEVTKLEEHLNELQEKTRKQKRTYEHKLESLYKEKTAIREKALTEARELWMANKKVEKAVQQIMEENKSSKKQLKAIRNDLETHKKEVSSELVKIQEQKSDELAIQTSKPPRIGDFVRFLDGSTMVN